MLQLANTNKTSNEIDMHTEQVGVHIELITYGQIDIQGEMVVTLTFLPSLERVNK